MKNLPYRWPLFARILYWLGFIHLMKRGKLLSGKPEEHNFKPSIGTFLMRKGEERLLKYCKKHIPEHQSDIPVQVVKAVDMTSEKMRQIRKELLPVLIKGGANHWRAINELTLEFFENEYGEVEVPAHSEPNKVFDDNGKPVPLKNFYQMSWVKLKDVINSIRNNGEYSVKAIEDIMHLKGDYLVKTYCKIDHIEQLSDRKFFSKKWYYRKLPIGKVMSWQLFMQPERSHTLWHTEPGDNFFIAAEGSKDWQVVPPYYSPGMYTVVKDDAVYHVSKVDGRERNDVIERRGFPLYKYVPKYSARVEKGDILYLPNYWWHTVTNVPGHHTISVTFRTLSALNLEAPAFWYLKKTDPKCNEIRRKVLKHGRLFDEDMAATLYAFADEKNDLVKPPRNI
ncbi:MAG: cupin-like domain-containing protein [Candidatus Rickettsiella isopodorum]|jgi:hypothetical protein|nr:cupin-like domain-containing protein [Flavobacterium sp.]